MGLPPPPPRGLSAFYLLIFFVSAGSLCDLKCHTSSVKDPASGCTSAAFFQSSRRCGNMSVTSPGPEEFLWVRSFPLSTVILGHCFHTSFPPVLPYGDDCIAALAFISLLPSVVCSGGVQCMMHTIPVCLEDFALLGSMWT